MIVKNFIFLWLIFYTTSGFSNFVKIGPIRPPLGVDWFRGKKPFNSKLTEVSTRFHSSAYLSGIQVGFLLSPRIDRLVVSEVFSIASNGDIIEHFSHRGALRSPLIQSQQLTCKPGTAIGGLHVAAGEFILGIEIVCKPLELLLSEVNPKRSEERRTYQQHVGKKQYNAAVYGQSDALFLPNWNLLSSEGDGRKSILHKRYKTQNIWETQIAVYDLICPSGTVGVGLFGEHGNCIDAIGLVCSAAPLKSIIDRIEMKALERKEQELLHTTRQTSLHSSENETQEEAASITEPNSLNASSPSEEVISVTINGEALRIRRDQFRMLAYIVMGIAGGVSSTQMAMDQPSHLLIITYAILGALIGVLCGDVYTNINDFFLALSSSAQKFDGSIESINEIIKEAKDEVPALRGIAEVKIRKAILILSNSRLSLEQKINHISNQLALKTEESRALTATVGEALKSNTAKAARFVTFGNTKEE